MRKDQESILVMIRAIAPEGKGKNLISTIRPLMGSIRSRAGCIHCQILQDSQTPEEMALLQEWENESAFTSHVGSRDYRYILEWMEMSCRKPEITIFRNPQHNGFEHIKRLINKGH